MRTIATALCCLLCAAAAPGASAQQVPAVRADTLVRIQVDTVVRLQPVRVRGLLPDDITATPGAAAALTADIVSLQRPVSLHDALDLLAGVRTIDDDILGRRGGIGIRGAPARRSRKTLLLEDGSPINSSAYLDPSAHYTPPLERLERVELLKGAGQILHGPLNNHGIVNFRNRRPGVDPGTTLEAAFGDHDTFRRHARHSGTYQGVGVFAAYTGMSADGTFDVERHRYDDVHASLSWVPARRQRLDASVTHYRERFRGYDEANLTPRQFELHPRSKRALNEGREFNNFSVDYWKLDGGHELDVAGARIASRAFATRLDRPRFATRGLAPDQGGVMEGRDRLYRTAGLESRLSLPVTHGAGMRHAIQFGLRHERHAFDYGRPVGRPGEALHRSNRGLTRAVAGVDGYTRNGRLVTYDAAAWSGFLQNVMQRGGWQVVPGVRLESYRQGRDVAFWPGSEEEGRRRTDHRTLLLPGISLLHDAGDGVQYHAGVHRGFAPATARTEEFPLVPETGVNSQVGVRTRLTRALAVDAALFYNRISNTLIRDDVDVFGEALFVNTADSRVRGADLAVQSRTVVVGLGIFADLAVNYTDARFHGGPLHGNRVPEVPRATGSFTAGAGRSDAWRFSATVSHLGAFFSDKENTRELAVDGGRVPARTLLSATASSTLPGARGARLWLQGRNLADVLYVSDVQDGLRPGAPRSVVAGVSVRF